MRYLFLSMLLFATSLISAQADSLFSSVLWEETSSGDHAGYILRLNSYGSFEEDAGEQSVRKSRYLMGRWEVDSLHTRLTLAVDYFMGKNLVHRRYRSGQDFYLDYEVIKLNANELILKDELTGESRTFIARPVKDHLDAAERRANEIEFGDKGKLKLPKGW